MVTSETSVSTLFTSGDREAGGRLLDALIRIGVCRDLATALPWVTANVPGLGGGKGLRILTGESSISLSQFERLLGEMQSAARAYELPEPKVEDILPGWSQVAPPPDQEARAPNKAPVKVTRRRPGTAAERKEARYIRARTAVIRGQRATYDFLHAETGTSLRTCGEIVRRLEAEGVVGPVDSAPHHGRAVLWPPEVLDEDGNLKPYSQLRDIVGKRKFSLAEKIRKLGQLAVAVGSDSELAQVLNEIASDLRSMAQRR